MAKRNNKARQCAAETASGKQCNRKAIKGSRYCAQHDKAKAKTKSATQSAAGTTGISNAEFAETRLNAAKAMAQGDVGKLDYALALNAKYGEHAKPFKVPHWSRIRKGDTNDNNRSYYDDIAQERTSFKEAYKVAYNAKHKSEPDAKVVNAAWGKVTTEARNQSGIKPKAKVPTFRALQNELGHTFKVFHRDAVSDLKGKNAAKVERAIAKMEEALKELDVNPAGLISE